jgi:hypothetical protein
LNAISTLEFGQGYGGVRASSPIFDLAFGVRDTFSYGKTNLVPRPRFRAEDLTGPGAKARYWAWEAEAVASAPEPAPERAPLPPSARRAAAPREPAPAAEPAAAAAMGTLHINSDVAGAQVFIDRNYVGVTPVTSPEIAPGSHRVNVVAQGFESIAENVEVEPGSRDLQFNFKEVRLDATVDVVHKHRIGSCKGRLVATPQGLRYDSDDKSDGVRVRPGSDNLGRPPHYR